MSNRFATAAGQLAGLAGHLLGWRPAEFWNATPAELAAILRTFAAPGTTPMSRTDLARLMEHEHD